MTLTLCTEIFIRCVHSHICSGHRLTSGQGNILIDEALHPRLSDLGLSNFSDTTDASASTAVMGARRFMAPEIHRPEQFNLKRVRHTTASDVFSFAQVIYQASFILHGSRFYEG